jgi:GNAT superfamily N-acetyltransferase
VASRTATRADLETVAEILAAAFYEDPVWAWAFPDPERRLDQHRAAWGYLTEAALDYAWVQVEESGGAAAVWVPAGKPELSPEQAERFADLLRGLLGEDAGRALDTVERFDRAHPHEPPHFYLSLLGTHPDHRGQGLGMELVAEALARIDELGAAAYLESTNPVNHRRYEGVGFLPRGSFELGEDGPAVLRMWRDPRVRGS